MIEKERLLTLISNDVELYCVEPNIYSIYPDSTLINSYDQNVAFYDRVIGNRMYNRLMWGYWSSEFIDFTRTALTATTDGWVLDAGCGSLIFSAGAYVSYSECPVVMLDQSIKMLRAAKSRLVKKRGDLPFNIVFIQGDILKLPFKPKSFRTIISMNVLHVIDDAKAMVDELRKVLMDGGAIFLTSLVLGRSLGDRYLRLLHRSGGVALPRTQDQISAVVSEMGIPISHSIKGNMMFIRSGGVVNE
jgi:ubiquinone/menaquinone biosynthesis C-methylase UbiE